MKTHTIALFEQKEIRRIWHDERWFFSVIDVIEVLTESDRPRKYWNDLKIKLSEEGMQNELSDKIGQLKLVSSDGKKYATDCADTETLLRIIQSIPSPKAEPFKRWLAKIGYERIQEIEDPELAMKRMRGIYEAKGYPKDWIDKRERGIAVRHTLTDEWRERGVKEWLEYALLTDEIYRATFGMGAKEYKDFKGIKRENLRDHMTDLELIFTMLWEASTTEILQVADAKGFNEVGMASKKWGKIAGDARKKLEAETGKRIVSKENFLLEEKKNHIGDVTDMVDIDSGNGKMKKLKREI